ncbi:cobalamin biosynthesis protein [Methanocella arvoryzae]|nr:cobalamin biosynthesis protein [Methanocella arvoryzae]
MIISFMLEAFILALLIDLFIGEPRTYAHPVVWIGTLIGYLKERAPKRFRFAFGFFLMAFSVTLFVVAGCALSILSYMISPVLGLLVTGYLLKSTFSLSFLWGISREIYEDLKYGRFDLAKAKLPALVGRDVSKLNEGQMSSCVVESLGESFVDGIMAPLLYFTLFGLPGALAYRAINTLDSMVGYKDEKHREMGFASAKMDDLVNYIPARLSLLLISVAAIATGHPLRAVKIGLRDARKPPSTNSGFPMATFAGGLGVRLEKLNYYVLGEGLKPCAVSDIPRAIWFNRIISALLLVIILAIMVMTGLPFDWGVFTWPAIY